MSTQKEIQDFLRPKKLTIAGASRNPKKFGGMVFAELKKKGFELFPVHPLAQEIDGIRCFGSVDELPEDVDRPLYCYTSKPDYRRCGTGIKAWNIRNMDPAEIGNPRSA